MTEPNSPVTELQQWYSQDLVEDADDQYLRSARYLDEMAEKSAEYLLKGYFLEKALEYESETEMDPGLNFEGSWDAPDYVEDWENFTTEYGQQFRELSELYILYAKALIAEQEPGVEEEITDSLRQDLPELDPDDYTSIGEEMALSVDPGEVELMDWYDQDFESRMKGEPEPEFRQAVESLNSSEDPGDMIESFPKVINGVKLDLGKSLFDEAGGMKKYASLPDLPTNMNGREITVEESQRTGEATGMPLDLKNSDIFERYEHAVSREIADFGSRIRSYTARKIEEDLRSQENRNFRNDAVEPERETRIIMPDRETGERLVKEEDSVETFLSGWHGSTLPRLGSDATKETRKMIYDKAGKMKEEMKEE